jgi:urease accessory protein
MGLHHQRARGRAELTLGAGSRTAHLFQSAPLRWLFPQADPGEPRLGALVNVAGGLAGGDRTEVALALGAGAGFTATTPSAEKVYRSLGEATEVKIGVTLSADALCEWLPQESILFDGARLDRRIGVSLDAASRLLAAEMVVLGRAAHGERLRDGAMLDRWRIRRDGRLIWADALRVTDPAASIGHRFTLGGAGAVATLLLASPDAAAHRERARELAEGAASLVAPGLLVARFLGEAGAVRVSLARAVALLRAEAFGHPPRTPRLWRS